MIEPLRVPRFLLGMITMYAFQSMVEDLVGKEDYVKVVQILWINTIWWWWPLGVLALFAFTFGLERLTDHMDRKMRLYEARIVAGFKNASG